jgi:hypothetical protein
MSKVTPGIINRNEIVVSKGPKERSSQYFNAAMDIARPIIILAKPTNNPLSSVIYLKAVLKFFPSGKSPSLTAKTRVNTAKLTA